MVILLDFELHSAFLIRILLNGSFWSSGASDMILELGPGDLESRNCFKSSASPTPSPKLGPALDIWREWEG